MLATIITNAISKRQCMFGEEWGIPIWFQNPSSNNDFPAVLHTRKLYLQFEPLILNSRQFLGKLLSVTIKILT